MAGLPGSPASMLPAGDDEIPRQIKDLTRAMTELGPSVARSVSGIVADLTAQVAATAAATAAVAAAQVDLAAAVANIATLVGQQTKPDAGRATTGGAVGLTASSAPYATITFNVPAGYTVASVFASTAAAVSTPIAAQIATRIAGLDGDYMNAYANSYGLGNGSSNFSRVFSVTPGGTFTVESRAYTPSAGSSAWITTAASVTFSR